MGARAELSERQREILSRRRRGVRRDERAGRLEAARRAGRVRGLDLDRSRRARGARAARAAHPSAHLGRPRADRGRATASTSTCCSRAQEPPPAGVRARARDAARRGRGGAAGDDRDALAGDAAARARLGAAARGRDRPSRRRAPAPAERRRRRRDHLDGRGDEAALRLRRSRSTRGSSPGRATTCASGSIGLRLRSRLLARAFDEPSLSPGERAFLAVVRGAFDDVEDERELYVGGAAGLLDDLRAEEIGAYRSLIDALEKRAALLDVLAQSLGISAVRSSGSATSSSSPACTSSRSSAPPTATRTSRSARSACSARCGWTTRRRSARCARRPTSSRGSSRRSTPTSRRRRGVRAPAAPGTI